MMSGSESSKATGTTRQGPEPEGDKVRFELYGTEILDKQVAPSGSCGRVYLPLHWLGKRVKIIRVN